MAKEEFPDSENHPFVMEYISKEKKPLYPKKNFLILFTCKVIQLPSDINFYVSPFLRSEVMPESVAYKTCQTNKDAERKNS